MVDGKPESKTVVTSTRDRWRSWGRRRKIFVVAGLLILAVGVFLLWPSLQSVVSKGYEATLHHSQEPCSGDQGLIREYNATVKKSGVTGLVKLQKTVQSKPDYKADPTCVYIVMLSQFGQGDATQAQDSFETLKQFKAEGKEPASAINDGVDRQNIYDLIQTQINDSKKGYYGQG